MAKEWKLPAEVQNGIRYHHKSQEKIAAHSISGILQLSEYLTMQMKYTEWSGMEAVLSPPLRVHVRDNIREYKLILKDLPEEVEKAKEIYHYHEDQPI